MFWEKSRKLFRKMVPQSTINAVQLHRAQSFLKTSWRADNTSFIWFTWILFNLAFQNNNSTYIGDLVSDKLSLGNSFWD